MSISELISIDTYLKYRLQQDTDRSHWPAVASGGGEGSDDESMTADCWTRTFAIAHSSLNIEARATESLCRHDPKPWLNSALRY